MTYQVGRFLAKCFYVLRSFGEIHLNKRDQPAEAESKKFKETYSHLGREN